MKANKVAFVDELMSEVAKSIATNELLQIQVAKEIRGNPKLISAVIKNMDKNLITRELVRNIMHAINTKSLNNEAHAIYANVMSRAVDKASTLVAERIAEATKEA